MAGGTYGQAQGTAHETLDGGALRSERARAPASDPLAAPSPSPAGSVLLWGAVWAGKKSTEKEKERHQRLLLTGVGPPRPRLL